MDNTRQTQPKIVAKNPDLTCEFCKKQFSNKSNYTKHVNKESICVTHEEYLTVLSDIDKYKLQLNNYQVQLAAMENRYESLQEELNIEKQKLLDLTGIRYIEAGEEEPPY